MLNTCYTLITGASEGFGKALAIECAGRNMNLILVALPGPELHSLTGFIKRNYHVEVIAIEKDLCKDESCMELYTRIRELDLQVNMLINNAGIGSTGLFEEGSPGLYEKQIRLNVLATTMLTRLFLKILNATVIPISSMLAAWHPFFIYPKNKCMVQLNPLSIFFQRVCERSLKKAMFM